MVASPTNLKRAMQQLAKNDPHLAPSIAATTCNITPHSDYYASLSDAIIGQQLSVKAAAAIQLRFRELFSGALPAPGIIALSDPELLRSAGLSQAKVRYLIDLASHIVDGRLDLARLSEESNDKIITALTEVKGIGTWTAQMFLIFCLGRLDVLPSGDLGIRNGIKSLYGLGQLPTPDQISIVAETNHWHPYESVASWYIWRSLENKPALIRPVA